MKKMGVVWFIFVVVALAPRLGFSELALEESTPVPDYGAEEIWMKLV